MKKIILCLSILILSLNANTEKNLVFSVGKGAIIQEISILVLKEAYSNIGINMSVKIMPNARALSTANRGLYDGDVSRIKGINKKFKNLIKIPVEINFLEAYAFSNKKDLNIENWESLKNYNIVSVLGIKFVEKNLQKRKISCKYVSAFTQAMNLVSKNRADLAIFPSIVGINAIRQSNNNEIKIVGKRLIKLPLFHYIHKKNKDLAKNLEYALLKMKKEGRIKEIREKYLIDNKY